MADSDCSQEQDVQLKVISAIDTAGVVASTICMIHCLSMPFLMAIFPLVAAELFEAEWIHQVLGFFVLSTCLMAFVPGYLRHRDKRLIYIGVVGVGLVFLGTLVIRHSMGEIGEIVFMTLGNTVLVFGHILNFKLSGKTHCKNC